MELIRSVVRKSVHVVPGRRTQKEPKFAGCFQRGDAVPGTAAEVSAMR